MVLNQNFQNFLNNCAKEQTDRTRYKVLEQRGLMFNNNNRTRSASLSDDYDPKSTSSILSIYYMPENEKIKALSNVLETINSWFVYR
jgi:hypothetical protein